MTTNLIEVMEQKPEYNWMDEARQIAAQAWCDPENSHKEIDAALCESLARRIAAWMQTWAQHAKNEAFWKKKFDELAAAPEVQQT